MTFPSKKKGFAVAALGLALVAGGLYVVKSAPRRSGPAPAPSPAVAVEMTVLTVPEGVPSVLGPSRAGAPSLRIITPQLLEVSWVSTEAAAQKLWGGTNFNASALQRPEGVTVTSGGNGIQVGKMDFRRRVIYAPLKERDLRIGYSLFLELTSPVAEGAEASVATTTGLWPGAALTAKMDPSRWSPAIHVNQTGYMQSGPKKAIVGYFVGTGGEADLGQPGDFGVVAADGKRVFEGKLQARPDEGFPDVVYQKVWEADFSALQAPGVYRLQVPGLGLSLPFHVGDEYAAALARTYALGLYHQRCGTDNSMPYTRFTHKACHLQPASVPDRSPANENSNWTLKSETENAKENPRHKAPAMKSVGETLYPFVNRGPIDTRGGHHDAGDYSKYTINSAGFIHILVSACDALPGVAELDNLGVPESGDGKGDVLQEAKWEADFLAKLQDGDGGFYFLVYPQGRRYENDVTPDRGDPQVVFPKNTAATAAAVAALAQCASSPQFKKQFPEAVGTYLQKARKGWTFLENAIGKYGKDGAYQKITHYGDDFMHDDELAWAAVELFLATGEQTYREKVAEWFRPNDPELRKWGWWRLFDAQGSAVRSYALAVATGRAKAEDLVPALFAAAQQELKDGGMDQLRRARQSAYGTSFPEETKRVRSAGWYFSADASFDLALAGLMVPSGSAASDFSFKEALLSNFNYEQGCNPVNIDYLTGLGSLRQMEIVHQYAQNDRRILPLTGIPLGNIQGGISWVDMYKNEPTAWSVPPDEDPTLLYPFYDRWEDAFNLSQEFVILNQARGLAAAAYLMAQTALKDQPWKSATGTISGLSANTGAGQTATLELSAPGIDLSNASIVWEAEGAEPYRGGKFQWRPAKRGPAWVECEAQLPDGRRVFAVQDFVVR